LSTHPAVPNRQVVAHDRVERVDRVSVLVRRIGVKRRDVLVMLTNDKRDEDHRPGDAAHEHA
jgi:hypothetical protein